MLEPAAAVPNPESWGPWQNLPCPDDLREIADACPHGWVELVVEQGRTASTVDNPAEGYRQIQPLRLWGVDAAVAAQMDQLIAELDDSGHLSKIPHGLFGLLCRLNYDPGEREVGAEPGYSLEVGWGADTGPVFNLPPSTAQLGIVFPGVEVHA